MKIGDLVQVLNGEDGSIYGRGILLEKDPTINSIMNENYSFVWVFNYQFSHIDMKPRGYHIKKELIKPINVPEDW